MWYCRLKAVLYGIGVGVWGTSESSLWGAATGASVEGMVIGSGVDSAVGLAVGVKRADEGLRVIMATLEADRA